MYRKLLIALLAGASLPLAFAPFYLFPLAVLAPALLLYCWLHAKPTSAFWYGLIYGIGYFGIGVSWVYISMHRFGEMPVPLACLLTLLFVLVLALFPALQGYLLKRYFSKLTYSKILLAFPATSALFDWIRSWLLSGFPWLLLGYSQTNSPLKGFAPIVGEYGLSFIITLTSALLVLCGLYLQARARLVKCLLPLGLILIIWLAGAGLTKINWTKPTGKPITVSLVQGNVPQQLKWQPEFLQPTLDRYLSLTEQHWHSDLIIWPEAAVPIAYQYAQDFIAALDEKAKQHHTRMLFGIPEIADAEHFYNALYIVGQGSGHYYKRQLVPFGEYLPFGSLLEWLMDYWHIPVSTMLSGNLQQAALKANGFNIAPFICYEIAYAYLIELIPENTDFLVTVSNDAWFGESFAPAQHLQIVQFRALTTGRSALVSTNNGVTAIIDEHGNVVNKLPQFTTGVLTGEIIARHGQTPLLIIKNTTVITLLWLALILAYWLRHHKTLGYSVSPTKASGKH